ncbi:ABC transporter substrate-binding protein [Paenibacillus sp. N4]|uniref:ABC transporter substrate-binding protein n=1 Tax=Paenibacillus vietnamensis TaxID=2590547 RepID=UPI001CD09E2D|nr:ABC transporter substrate-binding protein [Paenibacillus vietnamensis]MCA0756929.1 ABC transporter substrate-binding protein [Paenibacillus vietnamensis]
MLLLFLVLAIAACSANGQTPKASDEAAPQTEASPEAAKSGERVIEHDGGKTTITGEPQKIAVLDYRLADTLLALGIKPYAMATYMGKTDLPYIDGEQLADVIPLGDEVNLEALAAAGPDLIIARSTDMLENLEKIAPTIVAGKQDDWKEGLREMGRFLNREAEAEAWLAEFDKKAAELGKEIADRLGPDTTYLYLRVMPKEVRVHGTGQALSQTLFGELGLKPVAGLDKVKKIETISAEALPDFDADIIFMEVGTPSADGDKDARKYLSGLQETMVWQGLSAVKNGKLYEVPQWIISDYPHIKWKSLDIIREALLSE